MSAETLREAAALMRSRAEAAIAFTDARTGAPLLWVNGLATEVFDLGGAQIAAAFDHGTARHIASWPPAVALPVADWLESVAGAMSPPPPESALDVVDAGRSIHPRDEQHALAVARIYLGRDE